MNRLPCKFFSTTMKLLLQKLLIFFMILTANSTAFAAGALALDENKGDQWGWAVDYPSIELAEKRALSECGSGCRIVGRFNDGCMAYAADNSAWSDAWGWGASSEVGAAKSIANTKCAENGGFSCQLRAWGCDTVDEKSSHDKSKQTPPMAAAAPGVKRVYFDDFRRCSAWCPEAIADAQGDCASRGLQADIANCECNERKKPYYADVTYSCSPPRQPECDTSSGNITESIVRQEQLFFSDFKRCSVWCPQAIDKANNVCQSELGGSAVIKGCHCNERTKPHWAKVSFSCQYSPNNCSVKDGLIKTSLLMLIDTSGSMSGDKLKAAKSAAIESVKRSLAKDVEIAILAFSGTCVAPITKKQSFTNNEQKLVMFIESLQAGGATPLAPAIKVANEYLNSSKSKSSLTQMVLLLADGDNGCGDVGSVLAQLKNNNIIFRHETVGLEVDQNSSAVTDLKKVASATGGEYHHAAKSSQLSGAFKNAIETMEILNMLGSFSSEDTVKPDESEQPTQFEKSNLWDDL